MDLDRSSVLVLGAGSLGSAAARALAGAGVGRLGIVDPEQAAGTCAELARILPEALAEPYPARFETVNAHAIAAGYDLVIDCTNDEETRITANDACVALGLPLVAAAAGGSGGWLTAVSPGDSACLRCGGAARGESAGALEGESAAAAPLAAAIGSLAAVEALKLLSGEGEALAGRVLALDGPTLAVHTTAVVQRQDCPVCSNVGAAA